MNKPDDKANFIVGLLMIFGAVMMFMGFSQVYDIISYLFSDGVCR